MRILVWLVIALVIAMVVLTATGNVITGLICYGVNCILVVIIAIIQGNKAEQAANKICDCKCKGEHCETK